MLVPDEGQRRASKRDRLLQLLQDRQPHSSWECASVGGIRFGARLLELRQRGCIIDTIDRTDSADYVLRCEPGECEVAVDQRGQALLDLEI